MFFENLVTLALVVGPNWVVFVAGTLPFVVSWAVCELMDKRIAGGILVKIAVDGDAIFIRLVDIGPPAMASGFLLNAADSNAVLRIRLFE